MGKWALHGASSSSSSSRSRAVKSKQQLQHIARWALLGWQQRRVLCPLAPPAACPPPAHPCPPRCGCPCLPTPAVLFFGNQLTAQTKVGTAIALLGTWMYTEASKKKPAAKTA